MAVENFRRAVGRDSRNPQPAQARRTVPNTTGQRAGGREAAHEATLLAGVGLAAFAAACGARRRHAAVALHAAAAGAGLCAVLHLERLLRRHQRRLRLRQVELDRHRHRRRTGDFDVSGALVGGTLGYNMQFGAVRVRRRGRLRLEQHQGLDHGQLRRHLRDHRTTGSARRAAASATPSTASCPISPAARPSATSRARVAGFGSSTSTKVGWTAGGGLEYAFSTTGRPRSSISTSISARRPATPPAPAAIRST